MPFTQVSVASKNFKTAGPPERLSLGIETCKVTSAGDILVGAGDGTVALLRRTTLKIVRQTKVDGKVTAIVLNRYKGFIRKAKRKKKKIIMGADSRKMIIAHFLFSCFLISLFFPYS